MTFKIHTIMASDGAAAMITPGLSEMSERAGPEEIKFVVAGHLGKAIRAITWVPGPLAGSLPGRGRPVRGPMPGRGTGRSRLAGVLVAP